MIIGLSENDFDFKFKYYLSNIGVVRVEIHIRPYKPDVKALGDTFLAIGEFLLRFSHLQSVTVAEAKDPKLGSLVVWKLIEARTRHGGVFQIHASPSLKTSSS